MENYFQKEMETMPRERMQQLQSERLVEQVRHVYDRVKFYRERMDAADIKPRRTEQACAFHPLTRLDRDTFGVVLLAKNAHIHARLCQSLQAGLVEKTYRAAVFGTPQSPSAGRYAGAGRNSPGRHHGGYGL